MGRFRGVGPFVEVPFTENPADGQARVANRSRAGRRQHAHHGAGAVAGQHVVGGPDGQELPGEVGFARNSRWRPRSPFTSVCRPARAVYGRLT
jgi:hypothetical protein